MIFINRRGFAPVLYCASCKQSATCHRCDANLTLHRSSNRMRCHHCGYEGQVKTRCASCAESELIEVGEGTQRVEEALHQRFDKARVLRIDRDSSRRKGELEQLLAKARLGEADILVGTQLLTKGHDFPNVAVVGVLGVDQGLYSTDYRATEVLFQQVLQVAGRAGRRQDIGKVFVQTAFKEHPFFEFVQSHDFDGFAEMLLRQRQSAYYPPFGHLAMLRAESPHQAKALSFLRQAKRDIVVVEGVSVMDAIPAPMERRAGRYRAQLLISSTRRASLNAVLSQWLEKIKADAQARKLAASVRWSLDIDPTDHY